MVKRWVLLLKRRAHLLCDYFGAKDLTWEAMEELEDDVTVQWMVGLVDGGAMVSTECAIMAFSVSHCPNLVSRPFLCFSHCPWSALGGWLLTRLVSGSLSHPFALTFTSPVLGH